MSNKPKQKVHRSAYEPAVRAKESFEMINKDARGYEPAGLRRVWIKTDGKK